MKKSELKIYVVGNSTGYANWITDHIVKNMEECDLVLLTGGEDVNPKYYGEQKHSSTYFTTRDEFEFKEIDKAKKLGKPFIGICRGLQILTVAAGGKLIQDQTNRYPLHLVSSILNKEEFPSEFNDALYTELCTALKYDCTSENLSTILQSIPMITTSAHHQAAYPYSTLVKDVDYKILTYTTGMHRYHKNGEDKEVDLPEEIEIESILLHKLNAFGIQGHPEWMLNHFREVLNNLASKFKTYITDLVIENNKPNYIRYFILEESPLYREYIKTLSYFKSYLFFLAGVYYVIEDKNKSILGSSELHLLLRQSCDLILSISNLMSISRRLSPNSIKTSITKVDSLLTDKFFSENYFLNNDKFINKSLQRILDEYFLEIKKLDHNKKTKTYASISKDSFMTSVKPLTFLSSSSTDKIQLQEIPLVDVVDPFGENNIIHHHDEVIINNNELHEIEEEEEDF